MAERSRSEEDIVDRHLERAWRAFAPDPGLSDRVRARLTGSTAATMGAVALGAASKGQPQGAWASLQASGKLGAVIGTALLGVGLISGYLLRDARETPSRSEPLTSTMGASVVEQTQTPEPALMSAPVSASASAPSPPSRAAPSARERSKPSSSAHVTSSAVAAEPQLDELALLRRAERAVRGKSSALALALIAELEERYPRSSLLEERRAIELMAHCGVGASDAGRRARRFLNEHPRSVYAGRIGEMCPESSELSAPAR